MKYVSRQTDEKYHSVSDGGAINWNRLWLEAFENDGSMKTYFVFLRAATLRREQLKLTYFEEYHIPPLPATSPFLSSTDDSSDNDIPDTPPSPTHGTPFTETALSTQRSPVASGALQRRVMILTLGQPIPHSRPYHCHLNGPVHMMTARKRVGPLPTHRLAVRHSVGYSSSDHFSSDDSSRDSSSSSSLETSLDSSANTLSDSASSRSSSDHSLPSLPSALSSARVDLLPSPKKIRSPETFTDLEGWSEDSFEPYVPRETGLGVDIEDESSKPSRSRGVDLEVDVD
ncbi:hypothetical protein Tco_0761551 [Tanacetum coccineum]